jgi:hypothetical protein
VYYFLFLFLFLVFGGFKVLFKALTTGPTANPCTTPADLALERAAADAPWFLAFTIPLHG